jgi:hypothetical protein
MSILFCLEAKWLNLKRNIKLMKQNTAKKIAFFSLLLECKKISCEKSKKMQKNFKRILLYTVSGGLKREF